MAIFLYDSAGKAIAWMRSEEDQWVWRLNGRHLGWRPWNDADVYTQQGGKYLATLLPGHRLGVQVNHRYRGYPGYPGYPGYAGYPGYGGYGGYASLPSGFRDLDVVDD